MGQHSDSINRPNSHPHSHPHPQSHIPGPEPGPGVGPDPIGLGGSNFSYSKGYAQICQPSTGINNGDNNNNSSSAASAGLGPVDSSFSLSFHFILKILIFIVIGAILITLVGNELKSASLELALKKKSTLDIQAIMRSPHRMNNKIKGLEGEDNKIDDLTGTETSRERLNYQGEEEVTPSASASPERKAIVNENENTKGEIMITYEPKGLSDSKTLDQGDFSFTRTEENGKGPDKNKQQKSNEIKKKFANDEHLQSLPDSNTFYFDYENSTLNFIETICIPQQKVIKEIMLETNSQRKEKEPSANQNISTEEKQKENGQEKENENTKEKIKGSELGLNLNYSESCKQICRWTHGYGARAGAGGSSNKFIFGPHPIAFPDDDPRNDLVCPSMFRDLADYVVHWPFDHFGEKVQVPPMHLVAPCLLPGAIIYSQTGPGVRRFCDEMLPSLSKKFIFITGQSDYTPTNWCPHLLDHPLLIKWYAQNANVVHEKLIPIPIGLNCFEHGKEMIKYLQSQKKKTKKHNDKSTKICNGSFVNPTNTELGSLISLDEYVPSSARGEDFDLNRLEEPEEDYEGSRLSIVNFGTSSHERRVPLKNFLCSPEHKFVTCPTDYVKNAISDNPHLVDLYDIYSGYKFWFSPHGNGMDCHRTWEALYLGAVPVIEHGPISQIFINQDQDLHDPVRGVDSSGSPDLPVVIVGDMFKVNETFLRSELKKFVNVEQDFPRRKLTRNYWIRRIYLERRKALGLPIHKSIHQLDLDREPRTCWGK